MFMTTEARVRSSWVTFEPLSASCSGQPHRQGAHPLEQDVEAVEYADFTKEYGPSARKNNATNDFQRVKDITNSLLIAARMLPM